jgi:hypothetical protein
LAGSRAGVCTGPKRQRLRREKVRERERERESARLRLGEDLESSLKMGGGIKA